MRMVVMMIVHMRVPVLPACEKGPASRVFMLQMLEFEMKLIHSRRTFIVVLHFMRVMAFFFLFLLSLYLTLLLALHGQSNPFLRFGFHRCFSGRDLLGF